MNDLAARSLLDRDGATAGQADPTPLDTPSTHDFPLPSRSLRIGLGGSALNQDTVSTTEILLTDGAAVDDTAADTTATAVAAQPETGKPKHRLRAPSSALRARTALFAIAAGATAIAVTGSGSDGQASPLAQAPADPAPVDGSNVVPVANTSASDTGPGAVPAASQADMSDFGDQLSQGVKIAKEQAAAIAAKQKPLVVSPIPMGVYNLTSAFAPRWGTFHGGIDMAAPLGTPIHAATDGVVIDAGPASGFGNWVRLKAPDGTITVYGHMASSGVLVHKGQQVTAGDTIALVGSEGFSTGPHCHFEVWIKGPSGAYVKIDPAIWLAKKGVRLSALTG
ncbi:M23 family metallopeptidase [Gordonia sp. PS3]|uniref:M23ase beta-sheet core domain-containing protein n=1 Tax=Gordonia sihwensis NBRC 108236 TaxID=1223544 RepID=L7LFC0_9ACTN|nr:MULTISPECIES: M23 family metallopeptidase [Gordonia]KJR07390.1 peptidase M23 [Gordonia sihwensis]WFN93552.1 M23 family metallopeptidase [Gordonia sihwensis]GAC59431.1 hypothetical protein GSI01S_02_00710 [Gordonia sihwensis NBRC 108236]